MEEKKTESKAFELYDIRKEIMNIDYTLKLVEKNLSTLNIALKKDEVVEKELTALDPNCRVYGTCGRIFVLSSKDKAIEDLKKKRKEIIAELDSQNEKKKYLDKQLDEKSKVYVEVLKTVEKK
ncbi:MAG: prefoldin subunit [archaeon]|nr:prefoldin subunit [archaeon]